MKQSRSCVIQCDLVDDAMSPAMHTALAWHMACAVTAHRPVLLTLWAPGGQRSHLISLPPHCQATAEACVLFILPGPPILPTRCFVYTKCSTKHYIYLSTCGFTSKNSISCLHAAKCISKAKPIIWIAHCCSIGKFEGKQRKGLKWTQRNYFLNKYAVYPSLSLIPVHWTWSHLKSSQKFPRGP